MVAEIHDGNYIVFRVEREPKCNVGIVREEMAVWSTYGGRKRMIFYHQPTSADGKDFKVLVEKIVKYDAQRMRELVGHDSDRLLLFSFTPPYEAEVTPTYTGRTSELKKEDQERFLEAVVTELVVSRSG